MSAFRFFAQINPNAIGAMCCAGAVVLPISLLFYAAVLRTACQFVQKLS